MSELFEKISLSRIWIFDAVVKYATRKKVGG
jgi:hypothetical protein